MTAKEIMNVAFPQLAGVFLSLGICLWIQSQVSSSRLGLQAWKFYFHLPDIFSLAGLSLLTMADVSVFSEEYVPDFGEEVSVPLHRFLVFVSVACMSLGVLGGAIVWIYCQMNATIIPSIFPAMLVLFGNVSVVASGLLYKFGNFSEEDED